MYIHKGVIFYKYMFSCGSWKANNISKDDSSVLVVIANNRHIIFFWNSTRTCRWEVNYTVCIKKIGS